MHPIIAVSEIASGPWSAKSITTALGRGSCYQIAYDIVDKGYYLPPLTENKIINASMLAVKDVMIGNRDPTNELCLLGGRLR